MDPLNTRLVSLWIRKDLYILWRFQRGNSRNSGCNNSDHFLLNKRDREYMLGHIDFLVWRITCTADLAYSIIRGFAGWSRKERGLIRPAHTASLGQLRSENQPCGQFALYTG